MNDRRVKRFLIPVEHIERLLKGEVVLNRPLPPDAKIVAADYIPEYGEMQLAIRSAEYEFVQPHLDRIPLTINAPVIGAKP